MQRSDHRPPRVRQGPVGREAGTQGLAVLTHHSETASGYDGKVAAEMVGAKVEETNRWGWNPLRDHVGKTEARPVFSLIALVCAGYEKRLDIALSHGTLPLPVGC